MRWKPLPIIDGGKFSIGCLIRAESGPGRVGPGRRPGIDFHDLALPGLSRVAGLGINFINFNIFI